MTTSSSSKPIVASSIFFSLGLFFHHCIVFSDSDPSFHLLCGHSWLLISGPHRESKIISFAVIGNLASWLLQSLLGEWNVSVWRWIWASAYFIALSLELLTLPSSFLTRTTCSIQKESQQLPSTQHSPHTVQHTSTIWTHGIPRTSSEESTVVVFLL